MALEHEYPYQMANPYEKANIDWQAELNTLSKELRDATAIEARVRDLYRNDALVHAIIEKTADLTVGARVDVQFMPDHEALGVSAEAAAAWGREISGMFSQWAHSPENWISADRTQNLTQLATTAAKSFSFSGEIWCSREWRPDNPLGFNTCFNIFSGSRVATPKDLKTFMPDDKIFYGIEFDSYGSAIAYHIQEPALNQKVGLFDQKRFVRKTKYSKFNWLQIFHIYDKVIPGYPRGVSPLANIILPAKQRQRVIEASMMQQLLMAQFPLIIESDETPESVAEALTGKKFYNDNGLVPSEEECAYDQAVAANLKELQEKKSAQMDGAKVTRLFRGEKMYTVEGTKVAQNADELIRHLARIVCSGAGVSYEVVAGDFTGANFSVSQMSSGNFEHSANIKRQLYVYKFIQYIARSWLDEVMTTGKAPKLEGLDYFPNREAYSVVKISGSKRIPPDPLKSATAAMKNLTSGITSRTEVCNENGLDYSVILKQTAREASSTLEAMDSVLRQRGTELSKDDIQKIVMSMFGAGETAELGEDVQDRRSIKVPDGADLGDLDNAND